MVSANRRDVAIRTKNNAEITAKNGSPGFDAWVKIDQNVTKGLSTEVKDVKLFLNSGVRMMATSRRTRLTLPPPSTSTVTK